MSLIMLMSLKTVQAKIDEVKSSIGNTIVVSPAGIRGFEGGGELLTEIEVSKISALLNISKLSKILNARLTTDDTNLKSAIEAGSFGRRTRINGGGQTQVNADGDFTPPIMLTGTSDLSITSNLNVSQLEITQGEKFDAGSDQNVALLGKTIAEKNSLVVDSTFKAFGEDIKVAGIFEGGNTFANGSVLMPLKALQRLSDQVDQVSSLTVQTNSIDTLASVQTAIKAQLGDKADVISQQENAEEALQPLQNIKTISLYSLFGALVAGSIIIFLTMLMIVRERRREIGVLKAIGASNLKIVNQFVVESMVLTLMSSVVGMILGGIFNNPVLNVLAKNIKEPDLGSSFAGPGLGRAIVRIGSGLVPGVQDTLRNIQAAVGFDLILYGLLAAILIAVVGSALPAFLISKVRPAEVMRSE